MYTQEADLGEKLTVMYVLEMPAAALWFPLQRNLPTCRAPSADAFSRGLPLSMCQSSVSRIFNVVNNINHTYFNTNLQQLE